MEAKQIAKDFVDAVNLRDIFTIHNLLEEKILFVDSDGSEFRGKNRVVNTLKKYFEMFDTYTFRVEKYYLKGDTTVIIGETSGFIRGKDAADKYWKVPAAWKIVTANKKIEEWRIYTDSKPVWDILSEDNSD